MMATLSTLGLNSPLETRRREEQAGRGFGKGARHEPIPPAADSIVRSAGAFVFCCCRLASFLGEARKEGPAVAATPKSTCRRH
jgi:hypothetical protein